LRKGQYDSIPRRKSREFALQVLYQLNITKQDATTALTRFQEFLEATAKMVDNLLSISLVMLQETKNDIADFARRDTY
jgi:transcription termination factor NusB